MERSHNETSPPPSSPTLPVHAICPRPCGAPPDDLVHPEHGEPSRLWEICNGFGAVWAALASFPADVGRRGVTAWWRGGWGLRDLRPADLPLYLSERVPDYIPGEPLLVVSGCVSADAVAELGCKAVATLSDPALTHARAVWAVLDGEEIIFWPDATPAGLWHMRHSADVLGRGRVLDPAAELGACSRSTPATWIATRRAAGQGPDEIRAQLLRTLGYPIDQADQADQADQPDREDVGRVLAFLGRSARPRSARFRPTT